MPAIKPFVALCVAACAALCIPPVAEAAELQRTEQPVMYFGGVPGKAVVDTIDLMGPGGLFPYRGDFEMGRGAACRRRLPAPRVVSVDETSPPTTGMSTPTASSPRCRQGGLVR
jgi:hypothetical protein